MVTIAKMIEQQKELERKIAEQKENANQYLGEAIIDVLGIGYELLSTKKEAKEIAETIKSYLSENPFADEKENNDEAPATSTVENETTDVNEKQEY